MIFITAATAQTFDPTFETVSTINETNFAQKFNDYLGYVYDSHGCLHFTPSDIYLLTQTIPKGISLTIKPYQIKKEEDISFMDKTPYFAEKTKTSDDIKRDKELFTSSTTEIVVYPSLNKLLIKVKGLPYAKVEALSGPPNKLLIAFDVPKDGQIEWDSWLTTPTDPGNYTILRSTDHYISNAYYKNTIVPFGAWIIKKNGIWSYQEKEKWYRLPQHIIEDLNRPLENRIYNYYDVTVDKNGKIKAARYAGHDFGKNVLLWTVDGKNHYPEMGYAAGELYYEQIILVKDIVYLLTIDGDDDFESLVLKNKNFSTYKELAEFIRTKGKIASKNIPSRVFSYYRLYNGFEMTNDDYKNIDARVLKAFKEYKENTLPRDAISREKELGLVYFLKMNSLVVDKEAGWYEKIKRDWEFWKKLRIGSRQDFKDMGILSAANRQNLLEGWINDRLEFRSITSPKQAKNLQTLTFASFFKPQEEGSLFDARERAEMFKVIEEVSISDSTGLNLYSVDALNDYNFGILLNDILGELYKSHGCMHVSPRNSLFLYTFLPIGAQITIYEYSKKLEEAQFKDIPYLSDLVNFTNDLENLKNKFSVTSEVNVAVYPASGFWVVYLGDKPFTKLRVRGGPQAKMYLVQGREKNGKPVFESHLAYPTTPGTFYVFKKTGHYISNIYYDTTLIEQGGLIKKEGKEWVYEKQEEKWAQIPSVLRSDLSKPEDKREYTYYDPVKNGSGEVMSVRWGSHPFGKYAIQTTKDRKNAFPELIHSSGDLIMEERQLINDLIKVLSAPFDELDKCAKYSADFDLYRICYDFVNDPSREDLIQPRERGSYRLYHNLSLTAKELSILPQDVVIANKVLRGKEKLTDSEINILVSYGIANKRGGQLKLDMPKILGLQFDTYQYVVMIQKYAHHYKVLKDRWEELTELRRSILKDFNAFVIKDPLLFHNFLRELMVRRTELKKLTQKEALEILKGLI